MLSISDFLEPNRNGRPWLLIEKPIAIIRAYSQPGKMVTRQLREFQEVLIGALSTLSVRRRSLCRVLAVPVILLAAFQALYLFLWVEFERYFLIFILPLIFYTMIAVRTHRIVLLGEDGIAVDRGHSGKRIGLFILFSIVMGIFLAAFGLLGLVPIPILNVILMVTGSLYVLGRLSLVFPTIAVDRKPSLGESWSTTQGHGLLMFLSGGVPTILFMWVDRLPLNPILLAILTWISGVLQVVLTATLLSKCFQKLHWLEDDLE